jgi:hypothetical protein
VISIKRNSARTATVDFCFAFSLHIHKPNEEVIVDKGTYPISSGRETQGWTLLKGEWFETKRTPGMDYTKDTECADAK